MRCSRQPGPDRASAGGTQEGAQLTQEVPQEIAQLRQGVPQLTQEVLQGRQDCTFITMSLYLYSYEPVPL